MLGQWAFFGKQNKRCGMNRKPPESAKVAANSRTQKRCYLMETAGPWPWKLESAKKCVITYLPNEVALKMDGAKAVKRLIGGGGGGRRGALPSEAPPCRPTC